MCSKYRNIVVDVSFFKFIFFKIGDIDPKSGPNLKINTSGSAENSEYSIGICPKIITSNFEVSLILFRN